MKRDTDISQEVALIWNTANDVLRDIFQRTEYPDIIYPMVLIRRIEGVMIAKTEQLKKELESQLSKVDKKTQEQILNGKVLQKIKFNNTSGMTLASLANEGESSIKNNFIAYLNGYTDNIKIIIDRSGIRSHINKLAEEKILYTLIKDFSEIDLSPEKVSNIKMGYVFEELVRKFSEANNAETGEHYTPREVIDLMTHMLDMDEKAIKDGQLVTIYDPACGSGGMLSAAKEFIEEKINPNAKVVLYGQEVNDKTWAVAQADLLLKGETAYITKGDTLYEDGAAGEQFMPMVFPVQTRMKARIAFFKYPLRALWSGYRDFVGNFRQDLEEPYINLNTSSKLKKMASTGSLGDYLGLPTTIFGSYGQGAVALLNTGTLRCPGNKAGGGPNYTMFEYLPVQNSDQYYSFVSKYGATVTMTLGSGIRIPAAASASSSNFIQFGYSLDRKSTRLNSSHRSLSRMPSSA